MKGEGGDQHVLLSAVLRPAPRTMWAGSDVTEAKVQQLRSLGRIPPANLVACRVQDAGERVILTSHLAQIGRAHV